MEVFATIQSFNFCHFFCGQCEIEEVKVLLHTVLVRRLGDDDDTALHQKAQCGLRGGLAILCTDLCQHRVREHVLAPLGELTPGSDLAAVLFEVLACDLLLLEDMRFNLVDGGLDLGKALKVEVAVGAEVGNADGTELAGLVEPLHCAVRAVVIAERLVDEQQVEVVGLQLAHGCLD